MRKLLVLMLIAALVVPTAVVFAQDDTMEFDCGTDEEVTISFFGDPVGTHGEAEAATIERFEELCPNITVEYAQGSASVTDLLATYLTAFEAESSDIDVIRVDVIWPGL